MLLSLSGFLFEDDYRSQSIPLPRFCRIAREAGYGGVELRRTQIAPDAPGPRRRQVRRVVENEGLTVTCLTARGLPTDGSDRDAFFDRYLDLCRDLGCGLLKIVSDPAWMRQAAERADDRGVALAGNNHVGAALETVAGARRYLDEIGHRNHGLLYDAMHLTLTGEDGVGGIEPLFPFVRNILVQSVRPARADEAGAVTHRGRRWTRALVDEPQAPAWAAIFKSFRKRDYDGLVTVIENGWDRDRREFVAHHSAACLLRWWEQA